VPADVDTYLDELLRRAAPAAPAGFAPRVMARLQAQARDRRRRRLAAAAASVLACAAATLVVLTRAHTPHPGGEWQLVEARGVPGQRAGNWLPSQTSLSVDRHGLARLARAGGAEVACAGGTSARVAPDGVALDQGAVRLHEDGTMAATELARVTALGAGAQVEVGLQRSPAPVLTAYAARGGARVEAFDPPSTTLLAQGDRTLLQRGRPAATLRASGPVASIQPASLPPAATRVPAPGGAAPPRRSKRQTSAGERAETPAPGAAAIDKESIHAAMQSIMNRVKECYEEARKRDPKLAGRLAIRFAIRAHDGQGRVDEGEIDPDLDELQAPLMEQCVLNAVGQLTFPVPSCPQGDCSVQVTYPLQFEFVDLEKK